MKKIIPLIMMLSVLSNQHFCFAQNTGQQKIDSLLSVLSKTKEDTNKLYTLNLLCREYGNIGEYPKGLQYGNQALALATNIAKSPLSGKHSEIKQAAQKGEVKANDNIGIIYYNQSDYPKALAYYFKGLRIAVASGDKQGMADTYNLIGIIYKEQSDYPKALSYYFKSLTIYEASGNKKGISNSCNNIGIIYMEQSDYPKALSYYLKSLNIFEIFRDKKGISICCNNIGLIYFAQSNYSKSLAYHLKSLRIAEELGNKNLMAGCYNNIAEIYQNQPDSDFVKQGLRPSDRYPKALEYYFKSLKIAEELDDKQQMSADYGNIGNLYVTFFEKDSARLGLNLTPLQEVYSSSRDGSGIGIVKISHYGLLDSAFVLQKKALEINKEVGDKYQIINCLSGIGDVYFHQQKFKEAIGWYHQSYATADSIKAIDEKKEASKLLSDSYKKLKEFEKALSWHETYTQLKDSVFNEEKTKDLTRKEMNYEFDKKEAATKAEQDKRGALAKAEIKRQTLIRNSTFGGAGVVSIFSFFLVRSFNRRRKTSFEKQVSEVEMTALRSQMNPHFIFNSLHSINNYMMDNDKKNASDYLGKFSKLMRLILENSREQEVPLEKDLLTLELYMELEAMRFENKFSYKIEVADAIDKENTLVPPMILQPFVENSILHGLQQKEGAGKILISITQENNMITCIVEDNGVGREKAMEMKEKTSTHKGESLGIKITNARIDIINKLKKAKASVNLVDLAEGVRVEVRLPLELAF